MNRLAQASENKLHKHANYRADIDGLRALAIIPVVIFHAFPNILPGGFIGVDIFFVISGFLISTIIFRELRQENFSFLGFYARRVRRLFPALSLVLASTLIFGWFALDADEYKMLGKHIAAGVGFVQNLILWRETGYFDISSELKPLLHLWSLAIEEQFYLLFPPLVWFAWRLRLNLLSLVLVIAISSLAINLFSVRSYPIETFYFPHTRFWELMAGAILAYVASKPLSIAQQTDIGESLASPINEITRNRWIFSCIGLMLIVISTFVFDKNHHYPGWRAILPVLGAVLIIYAGQNSWINRYLLGNRLVIFIGLISYPLYLWHWPLLSFARIIEIEELSASLRIVLIGISFIFAALTYILIEKPIRSASFQKFWTIALVIIMLCIGAIGMLAYERELTSKLGGKVQAVKEWEERHPIYENNCAKLFPKWNDKNDSFKCAFLDQGKPEISVIGDSHARRIFIGISHFLSEEFNIALFANGCSMPFYDTSVGILKKYRTSEYPYTRANEINRALDFSINDPSVKLLVLTTAACWNNIVDIKNLDEKDPTRIVESKMRLTFDRLTQSGKQVIFVLDNPILDFDPKSCVSRPFRINSSKAICKMKRETFEKQRVQYFQIVNRVLPDYPKIKVFDVSSKLCDAEYCYSVIDNLLMYHDSSHLSDDGSKYIGQFIVPLIKESIIENK